jgi:PAS domain S-box-containing protein
MAMIQDITERKQTEERLRLLDFALDHVREGAFLTDENGRFRFVNEESCRILGYTRTELLGSSVSDIDPDFPQDRWLSHWKDLKTQGSLGFESRHRTRGGRIFPVEINASYFEYGGQGYNLALVRDVTERKEAEREHLANLRFFESADRVNRAIQGTNDLEHMMSDVLDVVLSVLDCDRAFLKYPCDPESASWTVPMERTKPEYPGVLALGVEMPMDADVACTLQALLDSEGPVKSGPGTDHPIPTHMAERFDVKSLMSMALYPKMDVAWQFGIQQCSYPRVWTNEEERLFQEIGRRLEDGLNTLLAHRNLRNSEERFRTVFEQGPLGMSILRPNLERVAINAKLIEMFGYTNEELRDLTFLDLTHPDDLVLTREHLDKLLKKEIPSYQIEKRYVKKGGQIIWVRVRLSAVRDSQGELLYLVSMIEDITEHKNLQKQLLQAQKMESIGTLAGGIAHDFNNLLQIILGYSDMLLFNKKPSDPDYERLDAIRRAGMDGAELAKRILAFSRRLEPNARPVNLNNEIARVQKMVERTVSKMIRIEILLADNLQTVNADPSQMEQTLLNLVVNAQHAMPDGGRLTIETANVTLDEAYSRTHLDVTPGRYVLLSVSDTGHGMDQETLQHIFEPFYTTKGVNEGTGLGLAMVFGIVKSHKGHIFCYSEPGAGTTFKIYLPAIVQEVEEDVALARQVLVRGNESILLVDDEKSIRKLGEEMLRMAGYTVLTAANGQEALDSYRSNQDRIALVLLDLMMPEMGGKQCLEELLKINPRVKVIIGSGYSANGPTKDVLAAGAKGFVDKPYEMRQVLGAVRGVLDAE